MADVIITPASGLIDFQNTSGISSATIQLNGSGDLIIAAAAGDIQIGDTSSDIFVGDGVNNVDIVFEQDGEIRGLTGKTITLGQSDSFVAFAGNVTGDVTFTGNITFSGSQTVDGRDLSADGAKLDGIESGATADQTASEILTAIKTVDGASSGLDADLLDGQQGSYYLDYNNFTNTPAVGGSPGGSNTQVQYNSSGTFAGSANLTFDGTNLTCGGQVSATDFNSTSDINLKKNIEKIENPLDKLSEISGVTFQWIENDKQSGGVIAQDVEKVMPELVGQIEDHKSVNYNGLIGLLVECVKEQQKQIDELKSLQISKNK